MFICLPGAVFVVMNLILAIKYKSNLLDLLKSTIMYGLLFPLTTLIK